MILSTIRMTLPREKHYDALKILRSIALQIRDNPNCLSCWICRDAEDASVLLLQEYWESEEGLSLHVRSNEYRNLLLVLEMSIKQPEIRFDNISGSTGIETIEKIRGTLPFEKAQNEPLHQ